MMWVYYAVSYGAIGLVAGMLAGLLGVGGGLVVVPALSAFFLLEGVSEEVSTHMAVASSLATIVVTGLSSTVSHHRRGAVAWPRFPWLALGLLFGSAGGALTSVQISPWLLNGFLGAFLVLMAVGMARSSTGATEGASPEGRSAGPRLAGAGAVIGWASAILGIGGGLFTVPLLRRWGFSMVRAVGTSAAAGVVLALGAVAGHVVHGWSATPAASYCWGFIHGPAVGGIAVTSVVAAVGGARLAHRLRGTVLRRVFAVFLFTAGLWFWTALLRLYLPSVGIFSG